MGFLTADLMAVARSLVHLTQLKGVTRIVLPQSEDLKCVNLFCEKVGGPCVCRLERAICREHLAATVEEVDLSGNGLTHLPPSIAKLVQLRVLDLSRNSFALIDGDLLRPLTNLQTLVISGNPLAAADIETTRRLTRATVVF